MKNTNPTLNDIIKVFSEEEIVGCVLKLYHSERKNKEGYMEAIHKLKTLKPKGTGFIIVVEEIKEGKDKWVGISGRKNTTKISYALEYTPWEEWLGMRIDKSSLQHYNYLEIAAYCLWEMTWRGYNQTEIQKEIKMLSHIAEKIKSKK